MTTTPSTSTGCARASATSRWSRGSTSRSPRARSAASSAPTAAARPRPSACCAACSGPTAAAEAVPRLRHPRRAARDPPPGRLHDAALQPLRGPDGQREPRLRRARLRDAEPARGGARHPRPDGPDEPARPARGPAVWRLETAAGARRLRPARTKAAAARRADGRGRRQGAPRVLGSDPRHGGRRPDHARLDPLHGRSRALQAHRLSRPGADRGAGRRPRRWSSSPASSPSRGPASDVDRVAVALRHTPGVEAAAVFGRALQRREPRPRRRSSGRSRPRAAASHGARSSRGSTTCSSIC